MRFGLRPAFVAHALREVLEVPVMDLTPGVEVGEVIPFDRALLGVPQSHTLFLFIFDAGSVTERKNPLGLITAFRRAFRSDDKTTLVIKAGKLEDASRRGLEASCGCTSSWGDHSRSDPSPWRAERPDPGL